MYCAVLYLTYLFKWRLNLIFHAVSLNYLQIVQFEIYFIGMLLRKIRVRWKSEEANLEAVLVCLQHKYATKQRICPFALPAGGYIFY